MTNIAPKVRRATNVDIAQVVALNARLFREDAGTWDPHVDVDWPRRGGTQYFGELIADAERNAIWLAEVDEQPIAYLVGRLEKPSDVRPVASASLESMYVIANYRSTGVGAALLERFVQWARAGGAGRTAVVAYANNHGAIRFYQRQGFQPRSTTLDMTL